MMDNRKEELLDILDRVLETQRFIEAKNGILLTIILALTTVAIEVFKINLEKIWHWPVIIVLLSSLVAILFSFKPVTKIKNESTIDNIYFFGNIAGMSYLEYKKIFENKSYEDKILDIYRQITINSKITQNKVKYYKLSLRILTIVGLIFYLFKRSSRR